VVAEFFIHTYIYIILIATAFKRHNLRLFLKDIVNEIRRHYPVSDSSINELTRQFIEAHYSKNHLLTQTGEKDNYVYFIERGCTRTFFFIGSNEVTNWFSKEGDITKDMKSSSWRAQIWLGA